jgi:hypothetical protein
MRRDGRSSGARIFRKPEPGNISPAIDEITVSGFPFPNRSKGRKRLRRERFNRSPAGRGQKGRAAFPVDRSWQRRNRRQELRRVLCAATGVRPARCFPQTGAGNISPATDEITVSGFPFPNRSNGRNRSGGNESTGAKRGAAKKAARLFRWTGAGNVGTGGRSCGAFYAPRRAFVQRGVSPRVGLSSCRSQRRRINREHLTGDLFAEVGRPGEQSSFIHQKRSGPHSSHPAIEPKFRLLPPARNGWASSSCGGACFR